MRSVFGSSKKLFLPVGLVVICCVAAAQFGGEPLPSIEDIQSSIRDRIEAQQISGLTLQAVTVQPRGTAFHASEEEAGRPIAPGEVLPAEDVISYREHRFIFSGESYREDCIAAGVRHLGTGAAAGFQNVFIFHGGKSLYYSVTDKQGRIVAGDDRGGAVIMNQCLFMILKGVFGPYLEKPEVLRSAVSNGARCVVIGNTDYAEKAASGAVRHEVWLDPLRKYLPVRFVMMEADGRVAADCTLEYEGGSDEGWRLKKFTVPMIDTEREIIINWSEYTVTAWETHVSAAAGDFLFTFPADAIIDDETTGKRIVGGEMIRMGVERWLEAVTEQN